MATLTLTPNAGAGALNLLGDEVMLDRAQSIESILPITGFEDTFAESPDTEGGRRARTRPQNAISTGRVWIKGPDLWTNVALWEQTIADADKHGAQLAYTPTNGTAVIFEIRAAHITSLPQDETLIVQGTLYSDFEFTLAPYGVLNQATVVSNANGTTPMVTFDVPELDGSVEALGIMTVTDTASQPRRHVEWGMESRYYDPLNPWDLFYDKSDTTALDSAAGSVVATSYSGTVWSQSVTTASIGVASATGTHVGRFRVRGRFQSAGTVDVRLGYAVRGGGISYKSWERLPVQSAWTEVDLGAVNFDQPLVGAQSVTFNVYAKATAGTVTLLQDYLKVFPAERYGMAHGTVGGTAVTIRSGSDMEVRYNGVVSETSTGVWTDHPNATGSLLRIPQAGGRMAVAVNRADLETEAGTVLGDSVRVDLAVLPRVLALGA